MTIIEPRPEQEYWPPIEFVLKAGVTGYTLVEALERQYGIGASIYTHNGAEARVWARVDPDNLREYFKARLDYNHFGDRWHEDSEHPFVIPSDLETLVSKIKVNNLIPQSLMPPLTVPKK